MGGSSIGAVRAAPIQQRRTPAGDHLRLVRSRTDEGPSCVGDLAVRVVPLDPLLRCGTVQEMFEADPALRSVLLDGEPPRLLNRTTFFQALSGRLGFGRSLLWGRSVALIDLQDIPVVWADEAVETAALMLAGTAGVNTLDDVMVRYDDGTVGTLNVAELFLAVSHRAAASLAEITAAERRFRALVERSSDAVVVIARSGELSYVGPTVGVVFGVARFVSPVERVHPDDADALLTAFRRCVAAGHARGAGRFRDDEGAYRDIEFDARDLSADPDVGGIVVNFRDVTERADLDRRIRHAAAHDALTGLLNRSSLLAACAERERAGQLGSIAFVDVDGFKQVNDLAGHETGDRLLVEVADRLRRTAKDGSIVARWGGDEFVVAVPAPVSDARDLAQAVVDVLREPVELGSETVHVSASVGVAGGSVRGGPAELIRLADAAMYAAKRGGGDRVVVWQPVLHDPIVRRALAADLAESLERGEVRIELQPIVTIPDRRIAGVEALARWTHPSSGPVSPSEFIPLAEEHRLIAPLGAFLIRAACRTMRQWMDAGRSLPFVDVNVSPVQLHESDVAADLRAALAEYRIPPDRLCVEITETALIGDLAAARRTLEQIRGLGVRVALDDFGVGYSSLGYLSELPIDIIKVDRVFVARLHRSPMDEVLVRGVVQLAHSLGLQVVAEGVETMEQLKIVERVGADLVQGFLLCPPVPAEALDDEPLRGRGLHWG